MLFVEKFILAAQKIELFTRFAILKQGQKSITEYVTEFEALLKYGLSSIDTPRNKNEMFFFWFERRYRETTYI